MLAEADASGSHRMALAAVSVVPSCRFWCLSQAALRLRVSLTSSIRGAARTSGSQRTCIRGSGPIALCCVIGQVA